jgi:hypothetical protein
VLLCVDRSKSQFAKKVVGDIGSVEEIVRAVLGGHGHNGR